MNRVIVIGYTPSEQLAVLGVNDILSTFQFEGMVQYFPKLDDTTKEILTAMGCLSGWGGHYMGSGVMVIVDKSGGVNFSTIATYLKTAAPDIDTRASMDPTIVEKVIQLLSSTEAVATPSSSGALLITVHQDDISKVYDVAKSLDTDPLYSIDFHTLPHWKRTSIYKILDLPPVDFDKAAFLFFPSGDTTDLDVLTSGLAASEVACDCMRINAKDWEKVSDVLSNKG